MEAAGRPGDDRPQLPAPSLWPVGFAVGVVCLLVGLIVSWPAVGGRRGDRGRLRLPLGRATSRRPAARRRRAGAEEPPPPRRRAPRHVAAEPDAPGERFPRSKFLEGATLGLGAVIGGDRHACPPLGARSSLPAFDGQKFHKVDLGPLDGLPGGQVRDRDVRARTRRRARSRAARRTSATTACSTASRASRSSPTAARTSAARCSRTARSTTKQEKTVKTDKATIER